MATGAERAAKLRATRKAAGRCVTCGQPLRGARVPEVVERTVGVPKGAEFSAPLMTADQGMAPEYVQTMPTYEDLPDGMGRGNDKLAALLRSVPPKKRRR